VVGGGFAGLSSAVYLAKNNFDVELIESAPKLGGRAYSMQDSVTGDVIDNGQHLLMGCYDNTLEYLKLIGSYEQLNIPRFFNFNFVDKTKKKYLLKTGSNFYPFNLLSAFLKFDYLRLSERLKVIYFLLKLNFLDDRQYLNQNANELLDGFAQTEKIKKSFWDFIIIGAMNCNPDTASASMFIRIVKQIFFCGNFAALPIIPNCGLSELYCEHSEEYLKKLGGVIRLSEQVTGIKADGEKVTEIKTNKRVIKDLDFLIFAIPAFALNKVENYETAEGLNFEYSAIISIHIWLKENNLDFNFCGLIDSPIHWVFNHKSFLTTVTSDANNYIHLTKEEIFDIAAIELKKYLGIRKEDISNYKVIKEKRATFIPDLNSEKIRKEIKSKYINLYLAGDWVDTGLPGTIESAVKSGKEAYKKIISSK
jgi:squalene-associated FAD-dependent desaturase